MTNCPVDDCAEISELNQTMRIGLADIKSNIEKDQEKRRGWLKFAISSSLSILVVIAGVLIVTWSNSKNVPNIAAKSVAMDAKQEIEIRQNKESIIRLEVRQDTILKNTEDIKKIVEEIKKDGD